MTTACERLVIEHAWDGRPLPSSEQVTVTLRLEHATVGTPRLGRLLVAIDAPFHDDPAPPETPGDPRSYDGLWNYEVVELFLGPCGGPSDATPYLEFEFGPYGHALGLALAAYRQPLRRFSVPGRAERAGGRWQAEAIISGEILPPGPWILNAYFIHGPPEGRQYGAAFPPARAMTPDFHHPGSWQKSALSWPST